MSDDDLKTAMQSLRKPRVNPAPIAVPSALEPGPEKAKSSSKSKAKAPARAKATKPRTKTKLKKGKGTETDPVLVPEIVANLEEAGENGINLKTQMTVKELKFIELYFTGEYTRQKAMDLAGYGDLHPRYKLFLASKILQKLESQEGDHRKIFREVGAGEVAVAQGLLKLATEARSEQVRLNAWTVIARCLGLQKETIDVQPGINIIISSRSQAPQPDPKPGGGRPALIHQAPKPGPKSISITK